MPAQLLHDALNSATPQIFDIEIVDGSERRVLNAEATEAAKEKLNKIKTAFTQWVWTDPDRADRLVPHSTTTVSTTWCRAISTAVT